MSRRFLAVLALVLWLAAPLPAAEPVSLEIARDNDKPVLSGEKCPITIDLLTATTFSSAVAFDLPTVPGGVLMQFGDRPRLGTRDQGGTSYTVQTYDLAFYALRPGNYEIPPFTVRFSSPAAAGGKPVDRTLTTKPLSIAAKAPPGTESLPAIVCAESFRVEEVWTPENPKTLHVGESLTRRITSTAGDVPSMVFPAIPVLTAEELKAYPQPPVAEDQIDRGDLTGKRIDTATYICQKPGHVSLPELVIPWWSLADHSLQEIRLPAVTFEIVAAPGQPAAAETKAQAAPASPWRERLWLLGGTSLLLASAATILFVGWDQSRPSAARLEATRFRDLMTACRQNNPRTTHDALFRWSGSLSASPITTCDELAGMDRSLAGALADLERAVATGGAWDGGPLAEALGHLRDQQRHTVRHRAAALPPLNP